MESCKSCKCTTFREEFRRAKFKLKNTPRRDFTSSSIIKDQRWFIAFKFILLIYDIIWWIFSLLATDYPDYFYYFTNFQDIWLILYLFISMMLIVEDKYNKDENSPNRNKPLWYHKISWIVHTIMMMSTFLTIIIFWTLIAANRTSEELLAPLNIHHHIGVTLIACLDLMVSDIPVRIAHCVYGTLYGYTYFFYNIFLHVIDEVSDIYSFTEWKKNPLYSAIVTGLLMTISPLFVQTLSFGVYKLRVFIRGKMGIHEQHTVDLVTPPESSAV